MVLEIPRGSAGWQSSLCTGSKTSGTRTNKKERKRKSVCVNACSDRNAMGRYVSSKTLGRVLGVKVERG
jgi:hypothetical protein